MGELDLTPEQREERRQRALRMHAEVVDPTTGRRRFGGPQPGSGRPRGKRASEIVAERVGREADKISNAIIDGLAPNMPPHIRLQAARDAIAIEQKEAELQLQEERALENLHRDQLLEIVMEKMSRLMEGNVLPDVDGTAKHLPAGTHDDGESTKSAAA